MVLITDNDGVNFCQEFRELCKKYVKSSSMITVIFNDGSHVGMRTLWEIGLGVKKIEDCIGSN